jgi:hypothetical protein
MEINITKFFNEENADHYYGSVATHGANAGKETYEAACFAARKYSLIDTPEQEAAFKAHIKGFGAWSDEEIAEWDNDELTGLFIQLICAAMKEGGLNEVEPDWEAYEADENNGGELFRGSDGEIYYTLSGC